jgi:tetratricopeptide (TPR) repeat protein
MHPNSIVKKKYFTRDILLMSECIMDPTLPRTNFIKIYHGSMELNIPISLFEEGTAKVRPDEARKLREKLRCQYPWLTDNAVDVILKSSSEEMSRLIEQRKSAAQKAREMLRSGRYRQALDFLDVHLDLYPEDADCWYVRSEALFKLDRPEEAFRAMRHAQNLGQQKRAGSMTVRK